MVFDKNIPIYKLYKNLKNTKKSIRVLVIRTMAMVNHSENGKIEEVTWVTVEELENMKSDIDK